MVGLMGLHFAVPFALLLFRASRNGEATGLFRIAVILLVMRYVDLYWLVVPGFDRQTSGHLGPGISLARLRGLGGHWRRVAGDVRLAVVAARVNLPLYDPELTEAAHGRPGHHAA